MYGRAGGWEVCIYIYMFFFFFFLVFSWGQPAFFDLSALSNASIQSAGAWVTASGLSATSGEYMYIRIYVYTRIIVIYIYIYIQTYIYIYM